MVGRPKKSEARDTRRDILDAALDLFADRGFYGTSLRDIARAVGVRESALYHHFPNKEALFDAVILADGPGGGPAMAPPVPALPEGAIDAVAFLERLALSAMEHFQTLRERKRFRILLTDGVRMAAEGRINYWERLAGGRQRITNVLGLLVERGGVRRADPELLTAEFMGPIMYWRHLLVMQPDQPLIAGYRAFARAHAEHFVRGAAPTVDEK